MNASALPQIIHQYLLNPGPQEATVVIAQNKGDMMPLSLGKLPQGLKDLWMSLNDPLGSLNANLLGQDIRIDFIGKKVKVVEKIPIANQLDIGLLIDPLTIIFQKFNKRIIIKEIFEIIDRSILKDRTTPDMKVTHNNFAFKCHGALSFQF